MMITSRTLWNAKGRLVVFALGALALELGMLLTPYPAVFNIPVTLRFVVVTMAAHAIFGIGLGLMVRWLWLRAQPHRPFAHSSS